MIPNRILPVSVAAAGALAATFVTASAGHAHGSHSEPTDASAEMHGMHELDMQGTPGMQRMHELHTQDRHSMDMHRHGR